MPNEAWRIYFHSPTRGPYFPLRAFSNDSRVSTTQRFRLEHRVGIFFVSLTRGFIRADVTTASDAPMCTVQESKHRFPMCTEQEYFSRHLPVGPSFCRSFAASFLCARSFFQALTRGHNTVPCTFSLRSTRAKSFHNPRHSSSATRFVCPSMLFVILIPSRRLLAVSSTSAPARFVIRTSFSSCGTERDPSV
jgi:hypothetical protein